jgi:hypothetical protein
MATFTKSQRNHYKLIHNGHGYVKHARKRDNGVFSWRCDKFHTMQCRARAMTIAEIRDGIDVEINGKHNHAPFHSSSGTNTDKVNIKAV